MTNASDTLRVGSDIAAAGEGGHNPLKRELGEQAIVLKRRRG